MVEDAGARRFPLPGGVAQVVYVSINLMYALMEPTELADR